MTDHEDLMKRCQRGTTNLNDANNLLAECYGMLGKLGAEVNSLTREADRQYMTIEAYRKDAERYRFLRDGPDELDLSGADSMEDIDALIDQAMSRENAP